MMTRLTNIKFSGSKSAAAQKVMQEALDFLHEAGIPFQHLTDRRLERMAMAFLAVADVKASEDWSRLKDMESKRSLTTRQIISYVNDAFAENISSGSYDDIRRKDLLLPVEATIVVPTSPNAARNAPDRGYALNPKYAAAARLIDTGDWKAALASPTAHDGVLSARLQPGRAMPLMPVLLPNGVVLQFSPGKHNDLQKAVIEQFLPRFGFGAELLYVGDAASKFMLLEKERLAYLRFFELAHGELPDLVAFSTQKNWLYLIEAVHSSGSISASRKMKLKQLAHECTADIIFVTAFLDRKTFRAFSPDIAWETEVWIAEDPDHLIHFNGEKFLGPYKEERTS